MDFTDNVSPVTTTTGCATIQDSMGSSTLTVAGTTEFLNGSSKLVNTISAPNVMPGKTLTLYAGGGPFTLAPGGGINFGGLIAPFTITMGGSVTLTNFDLGPNLVGDVGNGDRTLQRHRHAAACLCLGHQGAGVRR